MYLLKLPMSIHKIVHDKSEAINITSMKHLAVLWTLVGLSMIYRHSSCEMLRDRKELPPKLGRLTVSREDDIYILSWMPPKLILYTETLIEIWSFKDYRTTTDFSCSHSRHCISVKVLHHKKTAIGILKQKNSKWCCFKVSWYHLGMLIGQTACIGPDNSYNPSCRDHDIFVITVYLAFLYPFGLWLIGFVQAHLEVYYQELTRRQGGFRIWRHIYLEDELENEENRDLQLYDRGQHKDRLIKKQHVLYNRLYVPSLLDRMVQIKLINNEDHARVKAARGVRKTKVIVQLICQGGYTAYWKFLSALKATKQNRLVTMLETPGVIEVIVKEEGVDPTSATLYDNCVKHYLQYMRGGNIEEFPFLCFLRDNGIKVEWIYRGCVIYVLRFPDTSSLNKFKELHEKGTLAEILQKEVFHKNTMTRNYIVLQIDEDEFLQCKEDLEKLDGISYHGWRENLKKYKQRLAQDLTYLGVLEYLYEAGILTDETRNLILSEQTAYRRSLVLMEQIAKDPWAFVVFVEALDETGQEHLANLLNNERDGPQPMKEHLRAKISSNSFKLSSNLYFDEELLCALTAKQVLTSFDRQRISCKRTPFERSIKLFHIVKSKSDDCFYKLCEVLCDTNRHALSKLLDECKHPENPIDASEIPVEHVRAIHGITWKEKIKRLLTNGALSDERRAQIKSIIIHAANTVFGIILYELCLKIYQRYLDARKEPIELQVRQV